MSKSYGLWSATGDGPRCGDPGRQVGATVAVGDVVEATHPGSDGRKRAERALTSVVATCYLLGVFTRRMDKLVASLGIISLSKSQVSEMAKELDAHVEEFRTRCSPPSIMGAAE